MSVPTRTPRWLGARRGLPSGVEAMILKRAVPPAALPVERSRGFTAGWKDTSQPYGQRCSSHRSQDSRRQGCPSLSRCPRHQGIMQEVEGAGLCSIGPGRHVLVTNCTHQYGQSENLTHCHRPDPRAVARIACSCGPHAPLLAPRRRPAQIGQLWRSRWNSSRPSWPSPCAVVCRVWAVGTAGADSSD